MIEFFESPLGLWIRIVPYLFISPVPHSQRCLAEFRRAAQVVQPYDPSRRRHHVLDTCSVRKQTHHGMGEVEQLHHGATYRLGIGLKLEMAD